MRKPLRLAPALVLAVSGTWAQADPLYIAGRTGSASAPNGLIRACEEQKEAAQLSDHDSPNSAPFQPDGPRRAHATATVTVHSSENLLFDHSAGPVLIEIRLNETFQGDLDGDSLVRALQVLRADHSASLVSLQRFQGKLGKRQGTFVLQGSEIVKDGRIKATWFVVPGSGTGGLSGLRGEGGFEGEFGKASAATLDYWFE